MDHIQKTSAEILEGIRSLSTSCALAEEQ